MPSSPRDLPVWALAAASLRAGVPVALLCVVRSEGSSPGRQGFKISVTATEMAGSIGGGIMEHKWVELARQRLLAGDSAPLLRPQVHRREAPTDRSGMMCSGEQDVLLWPLTAADALTVATIEQMLRTNTAGHATLCATDGLQVHAAKPSPTSGTLSGSFYQYTAGPEWLYQEQLGFHDQLTIVGGGHVSLALARAVAPLGFEITVLDDRQNLPTLEANDAAHFRRVVAYEAINAEIPAGPRRYVVVMTVGYRTDAVVLHQLLNQSYRYLGVMGSVAKVAELRRGLHEAGFPAQAIARLRGPIGLPINSQTPEEIAISIAAELIQARHAAI